MKNLVLHGFNSLSIVFTNLFFQNTYLTLSWATYHRGDTMSYVNPAIKEKFESLSIDLKNDILSRNVQLNTLQDLIVVLEDIVAEEK